MLLTGKNINLRALEPADLEQLYEWENDVANWHVSGTLTPYSRFVLEQYISTAHQDIYTTKQLRLVIELYTSDDIRSIGCIDLFDFDPKNMRAGVGILIGDCDERNKGYASESLALLINYSADTLGLHQLYANISVDNKASLHLFK